MKTIDRTEFFDAVRKELYGGKLTQAQVDVMDPALTQWERAFTDKGHPASRILTECWVEGPAVQVLSEAGTKVLVDREGMRTTSYRDTAGIWTIGVGHAATSPNPPPVGPNQTITEEEAYAIFDVDNDTFEQCVRDAVTRPMAQHQFDAFVSIAFNIGQGGFKGSTFVKRFNAGESDERVVESIKAWNKPPEIIPRRNAEAYQFRDGVYVQTIDPMPPPKIA